MCCKTVSTHDLDMASLGLVYNINNIQCNINVIINDILLNSYPLLSVNKGYAHTQENKTIYSINLGWSIVEIYGMKIVSNLRSNTCTIIHGFHKCCKCILLSTTKCMSTCVFEIQNYMNMQRFVQIETCSWIQTFSSVLVYQNLQQWRCSFVEQAACVHSLVSLSQSYLINLDFETFFVAFFSISQPTHKQLPMNQLESVKFRIAWMCSILFK